jgi:hypothetical protein
MDTQPESIQILYIIFMAMGAIMLLIVYWLRRRRQNLIDRGHSVIGKVVDVVRTAGPRGGFAEAPVIQFNTYLNDTIIKTYPMGTNPCPYKKGDEVEIYYHPENPNRFVMKKDKAMRILFIAFSIMGVVFFLIGLIGMSFLK